MRKASRLLLLLLFSVLALIGGHGMVYADGTVILTNGQDEYPLGLWLDVLEDSEGEWRIEDVTSPEIAERFVPSNSAMPNLGFTDSAYWVRFKIRNDTDQPVGWMLKVDGYPFYVDFYLPTDDGRAYKVVQTGTARPFGTRDIVHPDFLFALDLRPGEEKTIHLRFESEGAILLLLSIVSPTAVSSTDLVTRTVYGVILGMLLIMFGHIMILYLYVRDRSYLYFALFLASNLMFYLWLSGIGHQYLWPQAGRLNAMAGQFFFVVNMIFILVFAESFLFVEHHVPPLRNVIRGFALAFAVLLPIMFRDIGFTARFVIVLTIGSYLLVIYTGFRVWRRGFQPARFFILAWVLWLTGVLLFVLSLFDVLPVGNLSLIGLGCSLIALILTLALALADRIRQLRQEATETQMQALQQQEGFRRALQEANATLEERVEERTHQLVYAQNMITMIFENSPLGIGFADVDDQVLTANPAMARLFGYTLDEFLTLRVTHLFPSEEERVEIARDLAKKRLIHRQMQPLRRKDGTFFFANLTEARITTSEGDVVVGVVDDITSLVEAQHSLQVEREEVAVLQERARVARDLHDSATQSLYAALLFSKTGRRLYDQGDYVGAGYYGTRVSDVVQQALKEMRLLIYQLRPEMLEEFGLIGALERRLETVETRAGVIAKFNAGELPPRSDEVDNYLFSIALEALNNAMKHASAHEVRVELWARDSRIDLSIADDGVGFDQQEAEQTGGMGLANMQERAQRIGATLVIESEPGHGSTIRTSIELARP